MLHVQGDCPIHQMCCRLFIDGIREDQELLVWFMHHLWPSDRGRDPSWTKEGECMIEISITIEYTCDKCGCSHSYDCSEPMTIDEIRDHIVSSEEWEYNNGELLCPDCQSEESLTEFLDDCLLCIRHEKTGRFPNEQLYCPHFKMYCEDKYEELWDGDDYYVPKCPDYLPIGGTKNNGPKYKPVENCSLNKFVKFGE